MAMAGGERFWSGQIPAGEGAGGEGKREGKHEEVLRYLWVVSGRLGMAGIGLSTVGQTGGQGCPAAGYFRWAKEGEGWLGRFCKARGSSRCGRFGEVKNGGGSSTATRAHGGGNGGAAVSCSRAKGLGLPFIGKAGRRISTMGTA
jgi:hypothetical protein